ncbi:MAG: outer membrane beta-barrel protein [Cyclobacteriaceae bacterium]
MRRFVLTFFVLALTLPAMAQVATGNKFINGTVRITVLGNNDNTQTAFSFSPTLGYFINDQMAVGGSLGIVRQSAGEDNNNLTVYLAPFVRRYFPIVDDTFYFFVNGSVGFSYGRSAYGFGEFTSTDDAFSISLTASPGFAYFPSERWGLDFTLDGVGLSFYGLGSEGGTTTLFTLGATTFSPSLGFSYYF